MSECDDAQLRVQLNQETARLAWSQLQRFFAQGRVLRVRDGIDLIEVAVSMARDDAEVLARALETGEVARVSNAEAREWVERDAELWAVVVKPWILVQST